MQNCAADMTSEFDEDASASEPSFTTEQLHAALADLRNSVEFTIGSELLELADSRTPIRDRMRRVRRVIGQLRKRRSVTQGSGADANPAAPVSPSQDLPRRPKVGAVLDLFSEQAFGSELSLAPLTRGDACTPNDYDYLLVESAWAGSSGSWVRAMNRPTSTAAHDLARLVSAFKGAGLPTVFWNKEDPTGSAVFLEALKLFDVVFSTDVASVEQYRSLGLDAHLLELFAATRIFNPGIAGASQPAGIIFPGSLRSEKYPERAAQIDFLLRAAAAHGEVTVYARPGAHESDDRWRALLPGLRLSTAAHNDMPGVYRSSEIVLNVSSVPNSESLVPRRVYEAMACRVPVLSAPSRAVEERFGDVVTIVETEAHVQAALERFQNDVVHHQSVAHRSYRRIHDEHAASNRIDQIHAAIGIDALADSPRTVAVVDLAAGSRPVEQWLEFCLLPQLPATAEVLVVGGNDQSTDVMLAWLHERSVVAESAASHDALAVGARNDLLAFFSTHHFYGPEYLRDLQRAAAWSTEAVLGKAVACAVSDRIDLASALSAPAFALRDDILVSASLMRRSVFLDRGLAEATDDEWNSKVAAGLSTSSFEFVHEGCRADWSPTELVSRCSTQRS